MFYFPLLLWGPPLESYFSYSSQVSNEKPNATMSSDTTLTMIMMALIMMNQLLLPRRLFCGWVLAFCCMQIDRQADRVMGENL